MDAMYNLYDSDGFSPFGERAKQKAERKAEEARLKREEARQKKIEEEFQNNTWVLAQSYDESPNHLEVEEIEAKAAAAAEAAVQEDSEEEMIDLQKEDEDKENKTVARTNTLP